MNGKSRLRQSSLGSRLLRRDMMLIGAAGIAGIATACGTQKASTPDASSTANPQADLTILNNALYYEHQAIWAYNFAAGKLTDTSVGKAVLALALRNKTDHEKHRDALSGAVTKLGGTPVQAEAQYDVSSYINKGEGNVDSDVNIAKLALALETDAAIAYTNEVAKLMSPELITVGASIGNAESAHAAAIRAAFNALGVEIPVVPAAFINAETREAWILKI